MLGTADKPKVVCALSAILAIYFPIAFCSSADSSCVVYVSDRTNTITAIHPTSGNFSTFAGNGSSIYRDGNILNFGFAATVTESVVSSDGSRMYVAELSPTHIRMINMKSKTVTTLAGSDTGGSKDGRGTEAQLNNVEGIALSPDDRTLYVAEESSNLIRKIDVATGNVSTLAGSSAGLQDGVGQYAKFNGPNDVAVSPDGKYVYVADWGNKCIRKIDVSTYPAMVSSISYCSSDQPTNFSTPSSVAASPDGGSLYVADCLAYRILKMNLSTGAILVLSGNGSQAVGNPVDGPGGTATFSYPYWITVTSDGSTIYVADQTANMIRAIDASTGAVSTLASGPPIADRRRAISDANLDSPAYVTAYCDPRKATTGKATTSTTTTTQATSTAVMARTISAAAAVTTSSAAAAATAGTAAGTTVPAVSGSAAKNVGPPPPSSPAARGSPSPRVLIAMAALAAAAGLAAAGSA